MLLWAVSASAQDAGAGDAGPSAVPDAGTDVDGRAAAGRLVYPEPGATGVVLNSSLLVAIDRAGLDLALAPRRAPPERPALGEGLLLRDDSGGIIAVGPLVAVETARPLGAERAPDDARVEIASGALELKPSTHYEVLSRVAVCAGEYAARVPCLQEEFAVLGDFVTGTDVDDTPPAITSIEVGPSPGECLVALNVVASDDHAAPEALRYQNDGLSLLGPSLVLPAPELDEGEVRAQLALSAIDPSNNRGLTILIEVDGCPKPDIPMDDILGWGRDDGPDSLGPTTPQPQATLPDRGCALSSSARSGATGLGALTAPLALAALCMLRRRLPARSLGR